MNKAKQKVYFIPKGKKPINTIIRGKEGQKLAKIFNLIAEL